MPNRKISKETKQLRGTYRGSGKKSAAISSEIGDAPEYMSIEEKNTWAEIVERIPPGIAGDSDRITMEILTRLLVKFREGSISGVELTLLLRTIQKFGLSPLDRDSVTVIPPEKPTTSRWRK